MTEQECRGDEWSALWTDLKDRLFHDLGRIDPAGYQTAVANEETGQIAEGLVEGLDPIRIAHKLSTEWEDRLQDQVREVYRIAIERAVERITELTAAV